MTNKPSQRKARQIEQQRQAIIEAAARAFVHAGFEGTTMRAIAQEAGFTASSLYTYFESKEQIFQALIETINRENLAVFEEPMPTGLSFEQRLELVVLRQLDLVEKRADAYAYLARAACESSGLPATDHEKSSAEYLEGLKRWFAANATDEDLGGASNEDAAYFVWGAEHGFFVQWLQSGSSAHLRDKVPTLLRFLLKGLRG